MDSGPWGRPAVEVRRCVWARVGKGDGTPDPCDKRSVASRPPAKRRGLAGARRLWLWASSGLLRTCPRLASQGPSAAGSLQRHWVRRGGPREGLQLSQEGRCLLQAATEISA